MRKGGPKPSHERRKTMTFTEIFNEAYNIFTDGERSEGARYNDMQRFLMKQVKEGNLSPTDKCIMARDVMETAGL